MDIKRYYIIVLLFLAIGAAVAYYLSNKNTSYGRAAGGVNVSILSEDCVQTYDNMIKSKPSDSYSHGEYGYYVVIFNEYCGKDRVK